jgi:hypothetical protein
MTPTGAKLVAKIRAAGIPLPGSVEFRRTYAGVWQRREGSWIWFLVDSATGVPLDVGSIYPRSKLTGEITADHNDHREWSIFPA